MRRLQHNHNKSLRTVQNQLLLLPLLPEVGVEEAQEGLQGADEPPSE